MPSRKRIRRSVVAMGAVAALGAGLLSGLGPAPGGASSHREAPLISGDPQADNTDVYLFVASDAPNKVTMIGAWIPFEEPAGGPNFYAFAENTSYNFNVDNDGDAVPDLIYSYTFRNHYVNEDTFLYNTSVVDSLSDPDLNFFQTMTLRELNVDSGAVTVLLRNERVVPSHVGDVSMPDYESLQDEGIHTFGGGMGKTVAGQTDDPFFLDLRVFDLLYGLDLSLVGHDTLEGFNVNAIALQVPMARVALNHDPGTNPIIGMWSTVLRQSVRTQNPDGTVDFSGPPVQVSRLGMPLVNEVVIPVGDKDLWNASRPVDDAQFLQYVNDPELARLIEAIYGIPAPDSDPGTPGIQRDDLIEVFLTGIAGLNQPPGVVPSEQLRLNMSIPPCDPGSCASYSRLGVIGGDLAGYPNGRRLADDVIDISLQVIEGILLGQDTGLGDAVDENDEPFRSTFPYLVLPESGSDASPHGRMRKL